MDFNQSNKFTNISSSWDHLNITMENDHTGLHPHHHLHPPPLPFNNSSSSSLLSSSSSSLLSSPLWPINFPLDTHHSTLLISSSSSTQIPSSALLSNDSTIDDNFLRNNKTMVEDNDDEPEEELGAVKEMMYKIAAMQPVDIDPATIRKPKRRNVRISDDPQSVAARHRREKISEKIRILQRLVPGGTKMDTASMLDEAVRYVRFLKRQIRLLQSNQNPPMTSAAVPMVPSGCIRDDWQGSSAITKPLCSSTPLSSSIIMEPETVTGFVLPMSSEPDKHLCFNEVINE